MKTTYAERVCRKKKTYENESDAAIDGFKYYINNKMYLRPYKCNVCGKIHLTKKDAKREIKPVIAGAMMKAYIESGK